MSALASVFEAPSVLDAAVSLLGMRIRTRADGEVTEIVLTEVEAYDGANDAASHAYGGMTERNAPMFGPPGLLYVYRSYGIHWCMNIVTGAADEPAAVLLRGGEITLGRATIERRRGREDHLTDGPGKLTQALGVDGSHNATSVVSGPVRLLPRRHEVGAVTASPRIGISRAIERHWRFVAPVHR